MSQKPDTSRAAFVSIIERNPLKKPPDAAVFDIRRSMPPKPGGHSGRTHHPAGHPMGTPPDELPDVPSHPGLRQTHPNFVYCEPMHTGVVYRGRPIRSNYKVHKLVIHKADELEQLMEGITPLSFPPGNVSTSSDAETLMRFIEQHEVRWSQRVDRDGREY